MVMPRLATGKLQRKVSAARKAVGGGVFVVPRRQSHGVCIKAHLTQKAA